MPGLVADNGTSISAQEAARRVSQEVIRKNSKVIAPLPLEIQDLAKGQPIKIYNIAEFPARPRVVELGSLGAHSILPCPPDKPYSEAHVVRCMEFETVAVDMNKMEQRINSGRVLALDILGKGSGKHASQDLTKWGVFIASEDTLDYERDSFNSDDPTSWIRSGKLGDKPTKRELEQAHARLTKSYKQMVALADEFAQKNMYQDIDEIHRAALSYLRKHGHDNANRDWMKLDTLSIECPGCGAMVNAKAAAHFMGQGGCGAVIDEKKVKDMRLPGYEHLWQK